LEDVNRVETANGNIQITAWEESSRKTASAGIDIPPASHWKIHSNNTLSTRFLYRRPNNQINGLAATFNGEDYLYNGTSSSLDNPAGSIDSLALPEGAESELLDFPNQQGSFVSEIELLLSRRAGGMSLTQTLYVNGYKVEWVTWNLDG